MLPTGLPNSENRNEVPVAGLVPAEEMTGEDAEDSAELRVLLDQARRYILSFSWCDSIVGSYFAVGAGKVFAIFLFHISPTRPEVDQWIWIIVGDIPSAYLPLADCRSTREVFETYIDGMNRWVKLARQGQAAGPEDRVPPVNVPATPEWAEKLDMRLRLLTEFGRPLLD